MSCDCQLIIKENDDDDQLLSFLRHREHESQRVEFLNATTDNLLSWRDSVNNATAFVLFTIILHNTK